MKENKGKGVASGPGWEAERRIQFCGPWWPSNSSRLQEAEVWQDPSSQGSTISSYNGRPRQLDSELGTRPDHSICLAWESSSCSQSSS